MTVWGAMQLRRWGLLAEVSGYDSKARNYKSLGGVTP
jgi:hypothetical protein